MKKNTSSSEKWVGPGKGLVYGEIADDDFIWAYPASLEEVSDLIEDPPRWIRQLNQKNTIPGHSIQLANEFAMRIHLPEVKHQLESEKSCLIQGINGTGVITIRAKRGIGVRFQSRWKGYWEEWAKNGDLDVAAFGEPGYAEGYGHFQITTDTHEDPSIRADKITAFIMLAADPTAVPSPSLKLEVEASKQLYMNVILSKTPRNAGMLSSSGLARGVCPKLKLLEQEELSAVNFTLLGRKSDYRKKGGRPVALESLPLACEDMAGKELGPDGIQIDEVLVKNYRR